MTETGGGAITSPRSAREYVSVGVPVPTVEIKVVDIETREKLHAFDFGELCIKGPICTTGYFNEQGNTNELFDAEGFLQTGDVAYYTEEGYVFIVDRLKEMFKCMDQQVAPSELEDILLKHPDVKEVVVVGVPHLFYGEAARAFIVLWDNDHAGKVTESMLRNLVEGDSLEVL